MKKDESKYDKITGQRKVDYSTGAGAGAVAGATAGALLNKAKRGKGAAIGAGLGALYGLAKIKGRNDDNKKNKRFAAAGYLVGKRAERTRLVKALETAKDKTKGKAKESGQELESKTASDYMKTRSSKSKRFMRSTSRRKFVNKGFGGSKRKKKI